MTSEELETLQLDLQRSGKTLKRYLHEAGTGYSTYNYWRKKCAAEAKPRVGLTPISFIQPVAPGGSGGGGIPQVRRF